MLSLPTADTSSLFASVLSTSCRFVPFFGHLDLRNAPLPLPRPSTWPSRCVIPSRALPLFLPPQKCCHFFNLLNLLHAPARPTTIMASASQSVNHLDESHPTPPGVGTDALTSTPDILDNALVIINYGPSARASLDLCMFADASAHQEELSVVGGRGKLEALLPQNTLRSGVRGVHAVGAVATERVVDPVVKFDGYHYGSSYRQHVEFLAAVRGGGVAGPGALGGVVGFSEGLLAVAMGVAAQESVRRGGAPVALTEFVSEVEVEAGMAASARAAQAAAAAATQ